MKVFLIITAVLIVVVIGIMSFFFFTKEEQVETSEVPRITEGAFAPSQNACELCEQIKESGSKTQCLKDFKCSL